MYILGIESSCDETAAAIVEDGKHLISNVISTSVKEQYPSGWSRVLPSVRLLIPIGDGIAPQLLLG